MNKIQIGYPLSDIPNQLGFEFRGITHNGDLIPCVVLQDDYGWYYAASAYSCERVYSYLGGWYRYLPGKTKEDYPN